MSDDIQLLPCPFCGTEGPMAMSFPIGDDIIECQMCGASIRGITFPTVVCKWNHRARLPNTSMDREPPFSVRTAGGLLQEDKP